MGQVTFSVTSTLVCLSWIVSTCNADPYLLIANRRDVQIIDADNTKSDRTVVISDLEDAAAVDFIYEEASIFWSDVGQEAINRVYLNDTTHPKTVVSTGLVSPDGLACDWLGMKLYWADSETNRIEVSNLDGEHRTVLYWQRLDQPRAIALDPENGYMYWTDWGETPKIEKAGMDGNEETRTVIIDENIRWPNGLTLDYEASKIYWTDARLQVIHSCDFDGKNRRLVTEELLHHPFALTLYGDYLYWTDWITESIYGCNKLTGADCFVVLEDIYSPMGIHAFMSGRQPKGRNMCGENNGGCSHLCLMSPLPPYFTCACPTGVRLLADNHTCAKGAEKMIFFSQRHEIGQISLDTPDYTEVVLPLTQIQYAIALDYDSSTGFIYWTDEEVMKIQRAKLDGKDQEVLVDTEVEDPDGIAIDWIAQNLYWTDTGTDRIEVSRLNGTSRKVLISDGLDEPRAICLDPVAGYMYWSDWGKKPLIERAYLDGTKRSIIVSTDLGWPNGLSIDLKDRRLYWGDAKTDRIEVADLDGRNRKVIVSKDLPHIFGFSLLGDHIYWTDWQRRSIERVNKYTGLNRTSIIDSLPDLMGLKAVDVNRPNGTNTCAENNGNCSHLCLYRPPPLRHLCACPMGQELRADGRTCIVPEAFLLFSSRSDIRRLSLETNQNNQAIPIQDVQKAMAIDFDITDNRIYWTDVELQHISRAFMNGSSLQHIIQFGLDFPEGMAVDWVAHNIYWADTGKNRIEVARLDGSSRKVLVWRNLEEPKALALDPPNGFIYWTVWGDDPQLERAHLDGTNRKVLISNMGHVQDLTIDFLEQRLYWADVDDHSIKSSNMNGGDQRLIVKSDIQQPMGLSQYQEFIYWTDLKRKSIERANKVTGQNRTIIQGDADLVMDISVYHASRQSGTNVCGRRNGGCSHLCLAHPIDNTINMTHHCACPTHYTLNDDDRTCSAPKQYLLLSTRNATIRLVVTSDSTVDNPEVVLPIHGMKNIKALAYDPVGEFIYWIEGRQKVIKRAHENGTQTSTVVNDPENAFQPYDIAIDPYSRTLYWTCTSNNEINVARIDVFRSPIGVIMSSANSFKPRSIALFPEKGKMYFTNMASSASIEMALMDGSKRTTLFKNVIEQPQSLTIDTKEHQLYWADLKLNRIEMSDLMGGNRRVLADGQVGNPKGLAVYGKSLYWLAKEQNVVERIQKKTGNKRLWVTDQIPGLSDIIAVKHSVSTSWHPCFNNNNGCSHLCFITEDKKARCSCPVHLMLKSDKQTCAERPTCAPDQFMCHSGGIQCIPLVWKCDYFSECEDNSDEENCEECTTDQFKCENGECIDKELKCDGRANCDDKSDEVDCCKGDNCDCADCSGQADCTDGSGQSCSSKASGAEKILFLARRQDICQISLDTPEYTEVVLPLTQIQHAIALDYDSSTGFIYWTDDEVMKIQRAKLDGKDQEVLVDTEVEHPDGIAIDWIAQNLYWTDCGTDRIEVSRLNGTSRKVLISDGLDEPRAICLDPVAGFMYWSDWGKKPLIERAYLDGTKRSIIVSTDLGWPNGLSIDLKDRRLYWGDTKTDRIEVADLDGRNRKVIVSKELPHIFGFSLLDDHIYWTDWQRRSIERVNKYTGLNRTSIIDSLPDPMGLKAVDVNRPNGTNTCAENNGNCSHLCLYRPPPLRHLCACPMGQELRADGRTCIVPEAFLLFSSRSDIRRLSLETNQNNQAIPIQDVQKAMAIDFDITDNRIYWTDVELQHISRAFMNGSSLQHIIQFGLDFPEGMAVDWVAHNIYWADTGKNRIEVARLDGSSRKVLVWRNLEEPKALALDPPNGFIYWTVWGDDPQLERAHLDGTNRKVLISNMGHVQDLTIDFLEQRLYWADVDDHSIKSSNINGGDQRLIVKSDIQQPMGLSQYHEFIYWTDLKRKSIERANKVTGQNRTIIQGDADLVMDISVYHASRQSGTNACGSRNGGCSHLCLAHPIDNTTNMTHHCACPTHYTLNNDNVTCSKPKRYLLLSTKNSMMRLVITSDSTVDNPDVVLPIHGMKNIKALAYDPVGEFIYWVEKKQRVIKRAHDNGTQVNTVMSDIRPYDIAIDPYSRTLYWTCTSNNEINVTPLDVFRSPIGVIVSSAKYFKPRSIALFPEKGKMYFTNMVRPPRIEMTFMDGSQRKILIKNGMKQPQSLTIDTKKNRLYWADSKLNHIEMSDLMGGNRRVLADGQAGKLRGLAINGNFLYWLVKNQESVDRIQKKTGDKLMRVRGQIPRLRDMISVEHSVWTSWHPCYNNNSGCSHLCFITEDKKARCSCPVHLMLKSDKQTCAERPTCPPDHFKCHSGGVQCIPLVWKCDYASECEDDSDEKNCQE